MRPVIQITKTDPYQQNRIGYSAASTLKVVTWQLEVLILSSLMALVVGQSAMGQQVVDPSTDRADSTSGSITGKVVSESGQPLAGAGVFVRPIGSAAMGRSTFTNAEGTFQMNGLEHTLYLITATSPAYVSPPPDLFGPPVTYRVGDSARLELLKGGVITGTVTSATGEPIVGIRVRPAIIRDGNGKAVNGQLLPSGERYTDDRGIYRLYGLSPGTYVVVAGGGSSWGVNLFDLDVPTFSPSSTRDTAAQLEVRSGEEVTADIRYRGDQGHSISGRVKTGANNTASVTVLSVGEQNLSSFAFQQAEDRGFAVTGLADGTYDLVAQHVVSTTPGKGFPNGFSDPLRVIIKGADVTGIELIPKPLGSISGKIALVTSTLPDCRNKRQPKFAETLVSTVTDKKLVDDSWGMFRMSSVSGPPESDGSFVLRNLRTGNYSVAAKFFGRYWYLQSITAPSPAIANKVVASSSRLDLGRNWASVKSGEQLGGLVIMLAEGAALVRGKVNIANGVGLSPDMRVYFIPTEREKADDAYRYFVATVASDGTFSSTNMSPGHYQVLLRNTPLPEVESNDKLHLPSAVEARLKLKREAEVNRIELELKPCQTLSNYDLNLKYPG